jgi:oligopeptide/dipeptide ABC transporter ATP-binding protein
MILALDQPTGGEISFRGEAVTGRDEAALRPIRRDMQVVFQDPYGSFDPRRNVEWLVAEPLHLMDRKPETAERRELVAQALHEVGLKPQDMRKYPHEFSGGQRQRISIARAIILRPKLVVADEPVSALDVSIQAQIINLLGELRESTRAGYAFIAHDLGVLRHVSDRVAIMYLGRIVEIGECERVFEDPRHPYTRALLASAPVDHPDRRNMQVFRVEGSPPDPTNIPSGCAFRTRCPLARDICAQTVPPLADVGDAGHRAACHFANDADILGQFGRRLETMPAETNTQREDSWQ